MLFRKQRKVNITTQSNSLSIRQIKVLPKNTLKLTVGSDGEGCKTIIAGRGSRARQLNASVGLTLYIVPLGIFSAHQWQNIF